jgi:succinate dehydrogenase / fumarate reductase membrane anchor subunit
MVTQATSFSRSGVSDWIIQRISAVILAIYTVFVLVYLVTHPGLGYEEWRWLFDQNWMRVFTVLALASTCAHAWIGMWTIGTDYIREHYFGAMANGVRFVYQVVCILILLTYLIWGVQILWGN